MQNLKSISVCESRVKVTAPGASPAPLYPGKPQKFCEYFNSLESVLPASVCEQYTVLFCFRAAAGVLVRPRSQNSYYSLTGSRLKS